MNVAALLFAALALTISTACALKTTKRMPIILGAGRGSTGTHHLAAVTCFLRYPSIHHGGGCIPAVPPNITRDVPVVFKTMAKLHSRLMTTFHRAAQSARKKNDQSSALAWRESLMESLRAFIEFVASSMGDFPPLTLHDSPYPALMPTMLKELKAAYNRQGNNELLPPIILLTERDPVTYVQQRIFTTGKTGAVKAGHAHNDLVCRKPFVTPMNPQTLEGGAFDVVGCINTALRGLSEEKASQVSLKDVFITMDALYAEHGGKGPPKGRVKEDVNAPSRATLIIAEYVKEYQNMVREMADFAIDIFTLKERSTMNSTAALILAQVNGMRHQRGGNSDGHQDLQYDHVNLYIKNKKRKMKRLSCPLTSDSSWPWCA